MHLSSQNRFDPLNSTTQEWSRRLAATVVRRLTATARGSLPPKVTVITFTLDDDVRFLLGRE